MSCKYNGIDGTSLMVFLIFLASMRGCGAAEAVRSDLRRIEAKIDALTPEAERESGKVPYDTDLSFAEYTTRNVLAESGIVDAREKGRES